MQPTISRDPGLSVYVHLPWCARKCHYCDFNSRPGSEEQRARYLDALKVEINRRAETLGGQRLNAHVRTIFFGGGTPTVYEGEELAEVLALLAPPPSVVRTPSSAHRGETATSPPGPLSGAQQAGLWERRRKAAASLEITCEANPETVDLPKLRAMRDAGFNRLSIGAQSFRDDELAMLGRGHTAVQTEEAVAAAREAGFENLSLDLIYALPGQTVERWRATLLQALALHPEHLSAYGLELCAGTPLHERFQRGEVEPVGESDHLAMREVTLELCEQAGLRRYEISYYALPGRESAHNITYWRNQPYLGLGAGAWSYLDDVRSENLREPIDYVKAVETGADPTAYEEALDPDDALMEALMMGLRMVEGLEVEALRRAFGSALLDEVLERAESLAQMGLLDLEGGRIRLTPEGQLLHSEVCVRLV